MGIQVRIPTPLRNITNGLDLVEANGANLEAVIDDLDARYSGMRERLIDEDDEVRRFVNIFVNGEDVRFLDGIVTVINADDEISIVPAVAGGR